MFGKLLRELKKLEGGVRIPLQINVDDNGQFDRRCPSDECQAEFKVLRDDWKNKVRDDAVFCPICRHESEATDWNTPAQEEYVREASFAHVQKVVHGAMREDTGKFNAHQPKGGFIQVSLSYRPSPSIIAIPPGAADCLRQQFVCETCNCRYSSLGAAFFCPACGHNSATTTFAKAVETVRASVTTLEAIRAAVKAEANEDAAIDTSRQILENGLVKLVASFQRFAESTFHSLPNAGDFKVRKNLFQNLSESGTLWRSATGKAYEDLLDASELTTLGIFFQQRHLLAHREGLVDQEYIDKARDLTYRVGQKLIIREKAVVRLADLVERLAAKLKELAAVTAERAKS